MVANSAPERHRHRRLADQSLWRNRTTVSARVVPQADVRGRGLQGVYYRIHDARMRVESFWGPWGHDLYLRIFVFLLVALPWWFWCRPFGERGRRPVPIPQLLPGSRYGLAGWPCCSDCRWPLLPVSRSRQHRHGKPVSPGWLRGSSSWSDLSSASFSAEEAGGAAALAVTGFGATAAWIIWLTSYLVSPEVTLVPVAIVLGLGLPAVLLAVRAGTRPFGPVLAATFAYLGLLAIRNMSLFGLVSGAVSAAMLGDWAAEMSLGDKLAKYGFAARFAMVGAVGVLIILVVTGSFYLGAEDCHRFGLRERPFFFAHDACRFAGQPGLPERCWYLACLRRRSMSSTMHRRAKFSSTAAWKWPAEQLLRCTSASTSG